MSVASRVRTGWYFKAATYIRGSRITVGFVSTNSITQGEQVGVLWNTLFRRYAIKIHFGHRTFSWASEARGKAHVHVVIIGFGSFDTSPKRIYDYEENGANITVTELKNISPYLIEGLDRAITNRPTPLCDVPEIGIGNKPIDGGYYLFTPSEKEDFLKKEPRGKKLFHKWVGSEEYINGEERWCLWLGDASPADLRDLPEVRKRIELVAKYRRGEVPAKNKSEEEKNLKRNEQTKKLANTPTRFHVENMPRGTFLLIPEVSSERRRYIPIGFITPDVMCSNLVKLIPDATIFHFGILSSNMHMAWVRQVCGRLESRYRYSNKLVYNNFPWSSRVETRRRAAVETAAQAVLDARALFLPPKGNSTLADLYDPLSMPTTLTQAHANLDRAVDRCYRSDPFRSDRERVEYLFALYEQLTTPLHPLPRAA